MYRVKVVVKEDGKAVDAWNGISRNTLSLAVQDQEDRGFEVMKAEAKYNNQGERERFVITLKG